MSVYQIVVDGRVDTVVDLADPHPWVQATAAVHHALTGMHARVEALHRPDLTPDIDAPLFEVHQSKNVVNHD